MSSDPQPLVPIADPDSAPFWDALREHRVTVQHCRACGANQLYFRALCRTCWSRDLEILECSGAGTVYSHTTLQRVGDPYLRREAPFCLAIVELDEGPRVVTRIDRDPDAVRIGVRLQATFRDLSEATLLHFELAADGSV